MCSRNPSKTSQCKNCKVSDISILVLVALQAELGINSQRKFYRICHIFIGETGLERTRFYLGACYLIPLLKVIHQWMVDHFLHDDIAIIDSFPLPLCLPVRKLKAKVFREEADISYNPSKCMWFYGFKVHMLVTLSGFIVNYIVTRASIHDS